MAKRATQGASNKLPFAQEYCLFSPVGFKGNLSLLEIFFFSRGLKQIGG